MPEFLVFIKDGTDPVIIDHVNAADIATAQTLITSRVQHGIGVVDGVKQGPILVGLVQLGAAFTITPT